MTNPITRVPECQLEFPIATLHWYTRRLLALRPDRNDGLSRERLPTGKRGPEELLPRGKTVVFSDSRQEFVAARSLNSTV